MNLSAEEIAQMIEAVNTPRHARADKRRAPRVDHAGQVLIQRFADGRPLPAETVEIRDVSQRGICIVCRSAMEPAEQFVLALPRKSQTPVHFLSTVIHCEPMTNAFFRIGAEFTCTLPDRCTDAQTPPSSN
ncbi:MAG TPA: PilZ domain-containing protein [Tepidisphaeraceae bacterium]|jgi:hypothetical protein